MNKIMHINSTAQIRWTDFFKAIISQHALKKILITQKILYLVKKKKIVSVVKNLSTKKMSGP